MDFLQYIAILAFGSFLMFIALVGGFLITIRLSPRSVQRGVDRLIRLVSFEKTFTARMELRPNTPVPSHVLKREIIPNSSPVWFKENDKYYSGYYSGRILGIVQDPIRGTYYHVESPILDYNGGTKWVPDFYIWEALDLVGDVVMAEQRAEGHHG